MPKAEPDPHPVSEAELTARLDKFRGSRGTWQIEHMRITEGCRYLADTAGVWWLIETIVILNREQSVGNVSREKFQVWKVQRIKEIATLVCTDGNLNRIVTLPIGATDSPLPNAVIWVEHGTLLLPSEH